MHPPAFNTFCFSHVALENKMGLRAFIARHRGKVNSTLWLAATLGLILIWAQQHEVPMTSFTAPFAMWMICTILLLAPTSTIVPTCAALPCRTVATILLITWGDKAVALTDQAMRQHAFDKIYAANALKVGLALTLVPAFWMVAQSYVVPGGYVVGGGTALPNATLRVLKSFRGILTVLGCLVMAAGQIVSYARHGNARDTSLEKHDVELFVTEFLLLWSTISLDREALDIAGTYLAMFVVDFYPSYNKNLARTLSLGIDDGTMKGSLALVFVGTLLILIGIGWDRLRHRRPVLVGEAPLHKSVPFVSQFVVAVVGLAGAIIVYTHSDDISKYPNAYTDSAIDYIASFAFIIPILNTFSLAWRVPYFNWLANVQTFNCFPLLFDLSLLLKHERLGFCLCSIAMFLSTLLFQWNDMELMRIDQYLTHPDSKLSARFFLLGALASITFFNSSMLQLRSMQYFLLGLFAFVGSIAWCSDMERLAFFFVAMLVTSFGFFPFSGDQAVSSSNMIALIWVASLYYLVSTSLNRQDGGNRYESVDDTLQQQAVPNELRRQELFYDALEFLPANDLPFD